MTKALEAMHGVVQQIYPLNATEWANFAGIWQPFDAKRKTILTASGEVERYVYFVTEGVQRAYSIDKNDRDVTLVFTYPPSFSGVADSFLLQHRPNIFF